MKPAALQRFRLILWVLVAVAAIGATVLFLVAPPKGPVIGGGNYALLDQRGDPIDQTMFEGHPSLLFFGYTHCPDVCPTTMAEMATWFEALGDAGKDVQAYFVTVDPARDTPEVIGDYVSWVSDRITGVTGSPEEIDKIVQAWGIVAEKVPGAGDDYTMNHTASVFLLNRDGGFEGTIAYGENAETALGKIKKLIAKS